MSRPSRFSESRFYLVEMSDDEQPPDLEETTHIARNNVSIRAAASPAAASAALSSGSAASAVAVVPPAAPMGSSEEPESLASQMLSASSATLLARAAKSAEAEKSSAGDKFLSGGASGMRKGFLLGGSSKKPGAAADEATKRGGLDLIVAPKGSGSGSSKAASSGGGRAGLELPEVQAAMASPSFAAKMKDTSTWMTPALMQRIASDPKLVSGMQNPKFMEAFNAMQKDPKGTLERAQAHPPLADFLQRFMAALGAHFTELGEKEDKERAEKAAKEPPPSADAGIGLAPKETRRKPLSGIGADTASIAAAAKAGSLPPGTDDEVRAVLSNPELVEVLNDAQIRGILDECRKDPYALRKYLGDVQIRRKLDVLSRAGLIQLS